MIDQAFLEQLHELNNKINAVKEQEFQETMACTDVTDILDKLKAKVRFLGSPASSLVRTFGCFVALP